MILIVNNHSKHLKSIISILEKQRKNYIIKDQESLFKNIYDKKISGIILSGGGPSLFRKIRVCRIRANISALMNFDLPVLGICEGHHITAETFGGHVDQLEKPIKEMLPIKILTRSKIFNGLPNKITAYEGHHGFIKNIPYGFELTATSEKTKVEAMFHKVKPIYTVQFHPERTGEIGEKIIKNFLDICKDYKPNKSSLRFF